MNNLTQESKTFDPSAHLIQLKGKDYLQVMWRLCWMRAERPNWGVFTDAHEITDKIAIFRAVITDDDGNVIASGYGSETPKDFGDYIEKAETKAIGRALAVAGFGTQFTGGELDEGSRIVDSPVSRDVMYICSDCGEALRPHEDWGVTRIAETTKKKYGTTLCWDCAVKRKNG